MNNCVKCDAVVFFFHSFFSCQTVVEPARKAEEVSECGGFSRGGIELKAVSDP